MDPSKTLKNINYAGMFSAGRYDAAPAPLAARPKQCFLFSPNIGYLTPKTNIFRYLKKSFPDQSIQKAFI